MFVVYLFWVTFSVNSAGGRDLWSKASSHQEEGFNGRERKDRKLSVYELSALLRASRKAGLIKAKLSFFFAVRKGVLRSFVLFVLLCSSVLVGPL